VFELSELYREALVLINQINECLKAVQFANVDDTLICAKADLRYWCWQYRLSEATVLSGLMIIEKARDALEGIPE